MGSLVYFLGCLPGWLLCDDFMCLSTECYSKLLTTTENHSLTLLVQICHSCTDTLHTNLHVPACVPDSQSWRICLFFTQSLQVWNSIFLLLLCFLHSFSRLLWREILGTSLSSVHPKKRFSLSTVVLSLYRKGFAVIGRYRGEELAFFFTPCSF